MIISLIVAYAQDVDGKYVIGKDGEIPWHYPHDLERFKEYTSRSAVIMGRKTHESIGRLLPERDNIVLTTQEGYIVPGGCVFHDLRESLRFAGERHCEVFIIGGQQLYEQTVNMADRLYITTFSIPRISGDAFFPKYNTSHFKAIHSERTDTDVFVIMERKEHADSDSYGGFDSYADFVAAYGYGGGMFAGGI